MDSQLVPKLSPANGQCGEHLGMDSQLVPKLSRANGQWGEHRHLFLAQALQRHKVGPAQNCLHVSHWQALMSEESCTKPVVSLPRLAVLLGSARHSALAMPKAMDSCLGLSLSEADTTR
jgi:hypothetical protein